MAGVGVGADPLPEFVAGAGVGEVGAGVDVGVEVEVDFLPFPFPLPFPLLPFPLPLVAVGEVVVVVGAATCVVGAATGAAVSVCLPPLLPFPCSTDWPGGPPSFFPIASDAGRPRQRVAIRAAAETVIELRRALGGVRPIFTASNGAGGGLARATAFKRMSSRLGAQAL